MQTARKRNGHHPRQVPESEKMTNRHFIKHLFCRPDNKGHLKFDLINLNSTSNWFTEVSANEEDQLKVKNVTQLEKDTILVCFESMYIHYCYMYFYVTFCHILIQIYPNEIQVPHANSENRVFELKCICTSVIDVSLFYKKYNKMYWKKVTSFISDQIKVVNISGKLKSSRRQAAHLHFDFPVEHIGKSGIDL